MRPAQGNALQKSGWCGSSGSGGYGIYAERGMRSRHIHSFGIAIPVG